MAVDLKQWENIVAACNRCGFCTSYCPTYIATGKEALSPRGRNQAFRALIEGKIKDAAQVRESVDTCLLCGEGAQKRGIEEIRKQIADLNRVESKRVKVALMPACGSQYLRPSVGLATVELMRRLNVDAVIPDALCCGLPAASYGVLERVQFVA